MKQGTFKSSKLTSKCIPVLFPQGSFGDNDLFDSLFEDQKPSVRGRATRGGAMNRAPANDNIFSMLAEEVKTDGGGSEDSDVSAADPNDILKNMKDMDDMDADLFALKKKPSSVPAQTKPLGIEAPKKDSTALKHNAKPGGGEDEPGTGGKKPNSAPSRAARNYRKFSFSDSGGDDEGLGQTPHVKDLDDPLADLDDLLPDETKPKSKSSTQPPKPEQSVQTPPLKSRTSAKTPGDLTFDDSKDDLMDALGFDSDKNSPKKKETSLWANKERSEPPQRARTRLDEILESIPSTRHLERPPTGERKDQPPSQEKQQQQQQQEKTTGVKEPLLEDDLTFGSYHPTLGSTAEGRQSRRQSVRFSTEDVSVSTPEKKPKPITATTARRSNSADWLGLKTNGDNTFLQDETKETTAESPKAPSSPVLERKPSLTGSHVTSDARMPAETLAPAKQTKPVVSAIQKEEEEEEEEEEDDWLAGALSRRKALSASNSEAKKSKQEDSLDLGEEPDLESFVRKPVTSQAPRGREDPTASVKETSNTFLGEPSPAAHSTPVREERTEQEYQPQMTGPLSVSAPGIIQTQSSKGSQMLRGPNKASDETLQQLPLLLPSSATVPGTYEFPQQNKMQNTSTNAQQQVKFSADSLQQLLLQQQMMQSQLLGVGDAGLRHRLSDKEHQPGDYQALQVHVIQLEGQVKTLQLERDQNQMMLESIQQQHKQDMELMENTNKARVKLLEESAAQREMRARQDYEGLMERLATVTQSAEQERSELQAQYQRKLAQAQQERDREVERLRDLQRKSISEMKKDHEDQVQRLKKLKDEEIDAVTSATSQTRSLTVVIEQMEQFSSRLGELSSRVESTHEHTAHGLEQGARHRDEQLRLMQDRLAQQQKTMAEERTYLKEIISRMDTQLNEQQRQLEKERWKMTAEQAKAEFTQRGLEEERRALSMQMNMEREELERAKSALLEEQKSVMQHCAEERRKLAAEWAHFHALEKQRHERAEREVGSLLEKREGSIIGLAQEQADLKLRTADVKQKEMAVAQERETLERQREELDREKERISSTGLRLKTRAQEVEAFSKLAADKYEEGERALQEAQRLEAEHEARLRNVHVQTERLRQQEQRILQERMRFNHLQETERPREERHIPTLPQMIPAIPDTVSPNPEPASTLNVLPSTSFSNTQSTALQASLALWKYTAEKDREYLKEEQIFLENLKKKSYRSSPNTDWPMHAGSSL
ncbi:fas-binding factor 1 homolog isoform X3 [Scophthalmus maximus]|uniref:fas-binding factor 1 homolog isoform X3 n=1 Tax=Scophthalmus maximus TaxID=52904 RepID=UPI001FA88B30|nr:fas-binding factor 1 homolog isoform X3 [Scophthalmus maximus]